MSKTRACRRATKRNANSFSRTASSHTATAQKTTWFHQSGVQYQRERTPTHPNNQAAAVWSCKFTLSIRASEKLQSDFSSFSVPHLDTRPDEISSEQRAQSNPCSLSCREHLNRSFPNAQCPPSPKDHNDTEQHKYTYTHAHDGFLFSIYFLALAPCNTSGRKEGAWLQWLDKRVGSELESAMVIRRDAENWERGRWAFI